MRIVRGESRFHSRRTAVVRNTKKKKPIRFRRVAVSRHYLPEVGALVVQLDGTFDPGYMNGLITGRLADH